MNKAWSEGKGLGEEDTYGIWQLDHPVSASSVS